MLSGSSIPFPTDWWYVSEPGPTLRICGKVLNSGATTSSPQSVPKCSPRMQVPPGAQAVWLTPEALSQAGHRRNEHQGWLRGFPILPL